MIAAFRFKAPLRVGPVLALIALLAAGACPAQADQDDARLNGLFAQLHAADAADARMTEALIWRIWLESPDPAVARLMGQGLAAMAADRDDAALAAFDAVVRRDSHFAEGWNKRATVEFMMGDFQASVADIEHTLALEPRHFGALSGLGQIYLELDDKPAALRAFSRALAIDPHLEGVKEIVNRLQAEIAGHPI